MDWANTLGDIVQRYSGQGGGSAPAPASPHQDFQQVAQAAPKDVVASGISQMFRSDQTPSFGEMTGKLFSQSNPDQKAGLLNELLGSLGGGQALGGLSGLGMLAGMLRGGAVTPQQTANISQQQVQDLAAHAERQNPSVVDRIGSFYSQHPQVVTALGGLALSIAVQHMVRGR